MLGSTTPRVWTPPLVELTPATSYGFDVIWFAQHVLGTPLDPWQRWAAIHLGELLPDGRPRFRVVLLLVARQNGKTLLAKVLIAYWMFVEELPLTLGTSSDRSYAKRAWAAYVEEVRDHPVLRRKLGPKAVRLVISEESIKTRAGAEYIFAANNRRAGRSTTLDRWVADELREHQNRDAWDAASHAMNAVPGAQTVAITNQGDDTSVVLDSLRDAALAYIDTGAGDPRLGLFEWSAPAGSDPTDVDALALANPNLGRRIVVDALMGAAIRAKAAGGDELAKFRTEAMCMRVHLMDPAYDPDAWEAAGVDDPVDLAEHRKRVALCVDVALDGSHASLLAAAVIDGLVHVEVVEQWVGFGCTQALRRELPGHVRRIRPRVLGWFPGGPAAAIAAGLAERKGSGVERWPPRGVQVEEISAEVAAVCMGLADLLGAGELGERVLELQHPRDPMLTQHVTGAQKGWRGDRWVLIRRGSGPIDGAYALAGAVHLARLLPPPLAPVVVK